MNELTEKISESTTCTKFLIKCQINFEVMFSWKTLYWKFLWVAALFHYFSSVFILYFSLYRGAEDVEHSLYHILIIHLEHRILSIKSKLIALCKRKAAF